LEVPEDFPAAAAHIVARGKENDMTTTTAARPPFREAPRVLGLTGRIEKQALARSRGHERPRFGFYVDHVADAFGALFVLGGLALSGLMTPLAAAALLAAYLLLAVQTYLATYAIGRFKISWAGLGGTELRIVLAILNVVVIHQPRIDLLGRSWLVFDLVGAIVAAALVVVTAVAAVRGTLALAREEGWGRPAETKRTQASG
jgi:hypothetical protein